MSEIDAWGAPGESLGRSLMVFVWVTEGVEGAMPSQMNVLDGIGVGCADHKSSCSSCSLSPVPDSFVFLKAVAMQWGEKGELLVQHVQDQI